MSAKILDGKILAEELLAGLAPRIAAVSAKRGFPPTLAVLAVGADPSVEHYMKAKHEACRKAGLAAVVRNLPGPSSEPDVLKALAELSKEKTIDGILIETPLPKQLEWTRIVKWLNPEKDVDGLTPSNLGVLFSAKSLEDLNEALVPATARAVIALILRSGVKLSGAHAVVVGRSSVVGRPSAQLLSCADATVTLCHSKTTDLIEILRSADIVVAAAGRPGLIPAKAIKKGAVVIDAGTTYKGKKVLGDVDFDGAAKAAKAITPVPGGVGPATTAMLLANAVLCAERRLHG